MADQVFNCINVHVTGFGDDVKTRLRDVVAQILADEIPATLPKGVEVFINHGGGGGPCAAFRAHDLPAQPARGCNPSAQRRDD